MISQKYIGPGGALAVFLFLVLIPLLWLFNGAVTLTLNSMQSISLLEGKIASYNEEIGQGPKLSREIVKATNELARSHAFYTDNTPNAASAKLGESLKDILLQNAADVRTINVLPAVAVAGVEKLQIDLDATLPMSGLPNVILSIQQHRPYVVIKTLSINRAPYDTSSDRIWITINVNAFQRRQEISSGYKPG